MTTYHRKPNRPKLPPVPAPPAPVVQTAAQVATMSPADALKRFDSVLCVNLDRRTDRWDEAQRELSLCGLSRCQRVAAVERPNATVGCALTHRGIWRRIAAGELGERVLVLEDDFKFLTRAELLRVGSSPEVLRIFDSCPGFGLAERLAPMLPHVPDGWDLLYLGGSYETRPSGRVHPHVIRNAGMLTTHSYAITKSFAQRLTAHCDSWCPAGEHIGPADCALAEQAKRPDVFSYTLSPRLFIQRPSSPSDINPQPLGFPWSMTDPAHEMMV